MEEKHLVCQGAVCQCIYGSITDVLQVKTQSKRYINDAEGTKKLIATNKELGTPFKNNSFGSCSKKKNYPCSLSVTEWKGFYEKVTLEDNGGKILLEDSTATCPIGGANCIKIVFHGQEAELSKKNYNNADAGLAEALNPAGDLEEIQQEAEELYDAE